MDIFETALKFVLRWEGGYVNHPHDTGGATNQGVTQQTYDAYRRDMKHPLQPVKQITKDEVRDIYHRRYWLASKADRMCKPLAIAHFDTAVNFGIRGAVMFLQEALGFVGREVDGLWGTKTEAKFQRGNNIDTALELVERRIDYRILRVKTQPSQLAFLRGWLNRDYDLKCLLSEELKEAS